MINREGGAAPTRREVEFKISNVGDYVKMDYLQQCLSKSLDFDTRKYVLNKLSEIYEARKMFLEAGKLMAASAEINATFDGKIAAYMKSTDLLIKAGDFDFADISFSKATASATDLQKKVLKEKKKEMLKIQAEVYMKKDKRANAMKTYERLIEMHELSLEEKKIVQTKLLDLYNKLGKVRELLNLQKSMN